MGYVDEGYEELYSDINRLGRGPQESYEALCSKSDSEVLDLFWDMYLSRPFAVWCGWVCQVVTVLRSSLPQVR